MNPQGMTRDSIFLMMQPEALAEVAEYLSYVPAIAMPKFFGEPVPREKKLQWFDTHRSEIEDEVCRVGSWTFGKRRTYAEIVRKLAKKLKTPHSEDGGSTEIEKAIIAKCWNVAIEKLTPEQIAELTAQASELAAKYGKNISTELAGVTALSAAQLSGFGVYLFGSTLLGAINTTLGLGLGFAAFTGLSSIISVVIGPIGFAGVGVGLLAKVTAPNHKKLLPTVICIAVQRHANIHSS